MRRRAFIGLLGGAAAWPLAARAQQSDRMRRIGVLVPYAEDDPDTKLRLAGFRQGLERLGWFDGRNVHIEYRFAPAANRDQARMHAKELVALQPDVILVQSTPVTAAFQHESRTVPIVFVGASDPIGSGFVTSLARPGGNLTGQLLYEAGIVGKWLAMLKEVAPRLRRAALVINPKTTAYDHFLRSAEAVAPALGIELVPTRVETVTDIENAP
jgi:putative tryptophan/tyrosine transport system substrate-binding protein